MASHKTIRKYSFLGKKRPGMLCRPLPKAYMIQQLNQIESEIFKRGYRKHFIFSGNRQVTQNVPLNQVSQYMY